MHLLALKQVHVIALSFVLFCTEPRNIKGRCDLLEQKKYKKRKEKKKDIGSTEL